MVIIAILKSLSDMKHLGNLRVSILIVFSLKNLSDFLVLSKSSNFSLYERHVEYYIRLWALFKFYEEYCVLVFVCLFVLPDN